jgi:autotransporter-associated beta strand protein
LFFQGGGSVTFSPAAGQSQTVSDGIADQTGNGGTTGGGGSESLSKTGAGTLILSGTNSYSSDTTVTGGLVNFESLNNLGSGSVTLNGGGLQWATGTNTDVSPRLGALGSAGGTLDTNGNDVTLAQAVAGAGGLTKQGSGALTLSASNTYGGATDVQSGALAVTGAITGGLTVESGASAIVSGTVNGALTLQSGGSLSCNGGTLNGGVINNGGSVAGGPAAPSAVSASGGSGQATVSFTPATPNCSPVSYTVTASPGGAQATGTGSPITVSGLGSGAHTFVVTASNPIGTSSASPTSNSVPVPPSASLTIPAGGASYLQGQAVDSSFSCSEGVGGSGISSCVDQSGHASGAAIDTSTPGSHTYTVTATSDDGLTGTSRVMYTVAASPAVSIVTPGTGATYTKGQVVDSRFTCSEGAGGPGIAACTDQAGHDSAAPIDTSTVGPHTYRVTATSQDGQSAIGTVSYTVIAPSGGTPTPSVSLAGSPSTKTMGTSVVVDPGIKVSCPSGGPACAAEESASAQVAASAARANTKRVVIGQAHFTIAAGKATKLTFNLNHKGTQLLRKLKHLRITVTVTSRAGLNHPIITTKTITITAPGRSHWH